MSEQSRTVSVEHVAPLSLYVANKHNERRRAEAPLLKSSRADINHTVEFMRHSLIIILKHPLTPFRYLLMHHERKENFKRLTHAEHEIPLSSRVIISYT